MTTTLVVCTHYPLLEATGGDMRTMHFVRFFRELGAVDLAYTFGPAERTPGGQLLRSEMTLSLQQTGGFGRRLLAGLFASRPIPVYRYDRPSRAAFAEKVASERYDYVLLRSAYTSGLVADLTATARARTILDLDDSVSGSLYDHLTVGLPNGARRRVLEINRGMVRRHEARAVRAVVTTVCTEEDQSRLARRTKRRPFLVPNIYAPAVAADGYDPGEGFALGHRLLFVGTLSYAPNVQGLLWFLGTVFPAFREKYPTATLVVIGRSPTSVVQSTCDATEGVTLMADAPDVLTHYADARVAVVPLLAGGGTRIKILEAAFAARPVLSTAIGAEGLGFRDGNELLLFENAPEFLRAYDRLGDEPTYRGLVAGAKTLLEAKYSTSGFDEAVSTVVAHLDRADN